MNISFNMALSMAAQPKTPSRNSSLRTFTANDRTGSAHSNKSILYKGISDRPLGWKQHRKLARTPGLSSTAREINMKRWDGASRRSTDWDELRKDPELWYPKGNCLVHLYGQGQSKRGPSFRLPMEALLQVNCKPLLDRFLAKDVVESPYSDAGSTEESYFGASPPKNYHLYIPPPATVEREEAFLYHTATRNFFAWIFRKSLVGNNLGGALVGLFNSMNQFRSAGEDNVQAIMDYMDEEGYADMRNHPDHALALLFFAEQFHFRDLWIDAFAHCTGMNEKLIASPGFEFMSRTSRAFITRSRIEMDLRLDNSGIRLASFLSDDLSETNLGLSAPARAHLDHFRTFLQSYYVAKLGYYPPRNDSESSSSFPKSIYGQMRREFEKLYDYLADSETIATGALPVSHQGGICVQQTLYAFDQKNKYAPLPYQLPLLPENEQPATQRQILNRRFSFTPRTDKMKPDPRLIMLSSLTKATNRIESIFDCTLVRAYRGFEKDCVFSNAKTDKNERLSQTEGRKVRWILIYATLQVLKSATDVPEEVCDVHNVPYNLCVLTAGCPPWNEKEIRPLQTFLRTQTNQTKEDFKASLVRPKPDIEIPSKEIKPDIDYRKALLQHRRDSSMSSMSSSTSRKSTVRDALRTLGNMPELMHPRPQRSSYHEILIQGYGNGTNTVCIAAPPSVEPSTESQRKLSTISKAISMEDLSRWSHSSDEEDDAYSPISSPVGSRRDSETVSNASKKSIREFLDKPLNSLSLDHAKRSSSVYSFSLYDEDPNLQPNPLQLNKNCPTDQTMKVTTEIKVEWEENEHRQEENDELLAYLRG